MTKASRKLSARSISTAALTSIGPRAVAAVALTAAFAFLAPNEGSLDTGHPQPELPDPGTLQDPLGISGGLGGVKNLTPSDAVKLASNAEELAIPPVALAAYQRSATVLNAADATCRLDWALIAAIGMVESNHGRFGDSELNSHGLALPAIVGPQLNGAGNYAAIHDTDNGLYDHDTVYDRAVGPMQFIPSTWTFAGADGDGDNRRDPQDIDDAAVATAAFLCAGTEDLSTDAGARSAVYRYNQSDTYVEAVLKIAGQYRDGDLPGSPAVDGESPSTVRSHVSALPRTSNTPTPSTKPQSKPQIGAAPADPTPSKPAGSDNTDDPATEPSSPPSSGPSKPAEPADPGDGGTTDPVDPTPTPTPTPTDNATPATLEQPCKTATTAVYGTELETAYPTTYKAVIDNCLATYGPQTTMPTDFAIREHLRTLSVSEDPVFADLPEPKDEVVPTDPDGTQPDGSATDGAGEATPPAASPTP